MIIIDHFKWLDSYSSPTLLFKSFLKTWQKNVEVNPFNYNIAIVCTHKTIERFIELFSYCYQ